LGQASEESACFLLSYFCDDENLQAYLFFYRCKPQRWRQVNKS